MVMTADGVYLAETRWTAPDPKAQVALLHGYAEHAQRYEHVARVWNGMGISVVAVDLRGHGQSKGPRGYVDLFEDYHHDVDALLDVTREAELPTVLFGHSTGGLIALHWLLAKGYADGSGPVGRAMISSPWLGIVQDIPTWKRLAAEGLAALVPKFSMASPLSGKDVAKDPNIAASYDRDPLVFSRVNTRLFVEVRRAMEDVHAGAGRFRLPMLLLYAGNDVVVSAEATDRFIVALPKPPDGRAETERLPGLYHEILNEPEPTRTQIAERFGRWVLDGL